MHEQIVRQPEVVDDRRRDEVRRHAGRAEQVGDHRGGAARLGRGAEDDAAARRERRGHRADQGRDGGVGRRHDHGEPRRRVAGPADVAQTAGEHRVPPCGVDRRADVEGRLAERRTRLADLHLDQSGAVGVEPGGDAVEQRGALGVLAATPGDSGLDGAGDDLLEPTVPGHPGAVDLRETELGRLRGDEDAPAPGPDEIERRVGVGVLTNAVLESTPDVASSGPSAAVSPPGGASAPS